MSRRTELEQLVIHEATSIEGIPVLIRMGTDPGRERMKILNDALEELEDLLKGEETLDRRFAFSLFALAFYVDSNINSWIREGREWPPELVNEEAPRLIMQVEYVLEGDLFEDEPE